MSLMTDIATIQTYASQLANEIKPSKIILFGSYASGHPGPDSDVDLLIIMPSCERPAYESTRIQIQFPPPFPLDLLVRSPEKVRDRVALGDCFIRDILTQGHVLYEAADA